LQRVTASELPFSLDVLGQSPADFAADAGDYHIAVSPFFIGLVDPWPMRDVCRKVRRGGQSV